MNKLSLYVLAALVLAFFVGTGFAQQQKGQTWAGKGYDPRVIYAGDYKATLLFFKHTQNDFWRRKPHMDRLQEVSCQDALNQLNSEGAWQGSLNADGSCAGVSIESPYWATGNRLNYDALLQGTGN